MSTRPLRFGVARLGQIPVPAMAEQARRAEQAGVDVFLLPDHLGMTAPLPPLVAIAAAAPTLRVGNLVLNCSFYRPALLARDLAGVDSATGGRLEIGLGTGYVEGEFNLAGLPFPSPGRRVDLVSEHAREIRRLLSSPDHIPTPVQTPPPIMIAGIGDRLLATAAEHADIVALAGLADRHHLAERVRYLKDRAGDRFDQIELGFGFFQSGIDDPDDLSILQMIAPDVPDEALRNLATYLPGPVEHAADRIRSLHEDLGISYFTFNINAGLSWGSLEKLIAMARR